MHNRIRSVLSSADHIQIYRKISQKVAHLTHYSVLLEQSVSCLLLLSTQMKSWLAWETDISSTPRHITQQRS